MDLDPASCYAAVASRDPRFDGQFFTGVVTTGVYCRPVCTAGPPKPQNVRFFTCAAAAEAAGFRPCRRCRPETSPGTPAWMGTSSTVSRALRLIAAGALDHGNMEALAARLGVVPRYLRRLFSTHLGASPAAIARARRVHFARRLVDETDLPMTQVARAAGFASIRQFNQTVRATFGRTPTELRHLRRPRTAAVQGSELVLRLSYRPPLDWPTLIDFLAPRAIPGVEVVTRDRYRRTIEVDGSPGTLELAPAGSERYLLLRLHLATCENLIDLVERARRIFDLGADPFQITTHLRRSPALAGVVDAHPGLRVPGAWDPFELAVRAVLGQQVTVRGATTLTGRLVAAFGTPVTGYDAGLTHLFPTPANLARADLNSIGIPRARATTIRSLAAAVSQGDLVLDPSRGLDEAVASLCAIPGVGAWTAHYIAMRALGEPDAFPCTDLGLQRALANGTGPISAKALSDMAQAWRPWRAYAAMYLWITGAAKKEDLHAGVH